MKLALDLVPIGNDPVLGITTGLVVNINPATNVHIDGKDEGLCIDIVFGDYKGGLLVLDGPIGMAFTMPPGRPNVFRSCIIPHWGTTFEGRRFSFIMNTGKDVYRYESFPALNRQQGTDNVSGAFANVSRKRIQL